MTIQGDIRVSILGHHPPLPHLFVVETTFQVSTFLKSHNTATNINAQMLAAEAFRSTKGAIFPGPQTLGGGQKHNRNKTIYVWRTN